MKRKKVYLLTAAVLLLTFCCLLVACGKDKEPDADEGASLENQELTDLEKTEDAETEEDHEGQAISPLTGEWIDEELAKKRPLAIMMGNTSEASPQSGIGEAGVIYEVPVEGGITRLMALIENYESLEKIGCVRSCRYYFVHYALEFDAVYAHFGQSKYAKSLLAQDNVNNINGLSGIGNSVFYRTSDKKAPHNAFADGAQIAAAVEKLKYRSEYQEGWQSHYCFADEKQPTLNEDGIAANYVAPGYSIDAPWYEYNEEDGLYYRFQYKKEHTDALTGEQLTCKNIIMQYSKIGYLDDNYSLKIDTESGGAGMYITNGKAIDITWEKSGNITRYYDAKGNEIALNPGKTWVLIINRSSLDRVKILEQKE